MRGKSTAVLALLVMAGVFLLPGCGAEVDKSEVEQAANPVKSMHQEVRNRLQAEEGRVQWYKYEDAVALARKENKFVMVDFYATWCKWCKKFEAGTITDPEVAETMKEGFVAVRLDAESSTKVVHEMRQMTAFELADIYEVKTFPTIWFIAPDGSRAKRLDGYLEPKDFNNYLKYIRSGAYREREF